MQQTCNGSGDPTQTQTGLRIILQTRQLDAPLSFFEATTLRDVLKQASQRAGLDRWERAAVMEHIDKLDNLIEQLMEPAPR
jgi:hypothetical protein